MRSWILLLGLAACGEVQNKLADAPPGDDIDAAIDAQTTGPVTIRVNDSDGTPRQVAVAFVTADGQPVAGAPTTTDANGVATATITVGDSVTIWNAFGSSEQLLTFIGLEPNDDIPIALPEGPPSVQITVSAPVLNGMTVAAYRLVSTCDTTQRTMTVANNIATGTFSISCPAMADLGVVAFDSNGNPLGAQIVLDNAIVGNATFDFTGRAYVLSTKITAGIALPPGTMRVNVQPSVATARGQIFAGITGAPAITNNSATFVEQVFPAARTFQNVSYADETEYAGQIFQWGPSPTVDATYSLDVNASGIGAPTNRAYDQATRRTSWTRGGGVAASSVVLNTAIERGEEGWFWTVVAPAEPQSVTLPTLPLVDGKDWNPASGEVVNVALAQYDFPGGYDAFRTRAASVRSITDFFTAPAGSAAALQVTVLEPPMAKLLPVSHRFPHHVQRLLR